MQKAVKGERHKPQAAAVAPKMSYLVNLARSKPATSWMRFLKALLGTLMRSLVALLAGTGAGAGLAGGPPERQHGANRLMETSESCAHLYPKNHLQKPRLCVACHGCVPPGSRGGGSELASRSAPQCKCQGFQGRCDSKDCHPKESGPCGACRSVSHNNGTTLNPPYIAHEATMILCGSARLLQPVRVPTTAMIKLISALAS